MDNLLKFIYYSEKATKSCEIFLLLLSYVVPVNSKVKISQNFVAFSEYMNFNHSNATSERVDSIVNCLKKVFHSSYLYLSIFHFL